jgi:hypothetical protein
MIHDLAVSVLRYLTLSVPAFNFLGALTSLLAAICWYQAAQVKAPPSALFGIAGFADADYGNGSNAFVDATPLVEYAQRSGQRNRVAALCSASAALLMGLTWFLPWAMGLLAHA